MNAPDFWSDFSAVFADELAAKPLTPEQMDAMADEYQREQIATAQSEATQQAIARSYAK